MSELDSTSTSTSSSIKQQSQKAITATTGGVVGGGGVGERVGVPGTVANNNIKSEINVKIKNEDENVENYDDGKVKEEGEIKNGGVRVPAPAAAAAVTTTAAAVAAVTVTAATVAAAVPVQDSESSTSYSSSGQDTRISLIQVRTYVHPCVLSHSF